MQLTFRRRRMPYKRSKSTELQSLEHPPLQCRTHPKRSDIGNFSVINIIEGEIRTPRNSVICHESLRPMTSAKLPHVVAPTMSPAYIDRVTYSIRGGLRSSCTCGRTTATPCSHKSEESQFMSTLMRVMGLTDLLSANHPNPDRMKSSHW